MKIQKKEVEHVAKLARLVFSEKEKELFGQQLSSILTYIEKLNELDTSNVEPTTHVVPLHNVFREDEVRPSLSAESALSNAPEKTDGFYRVPKIIED
ncbi:MAG TPA: Asp-tRNA(Asn)/Glu-tRNA(Gln) amidotransferase subunit GatC [Nitrospiria bacterium]|jgi:aspartyl-tRNA(Asn)/glutamyl-tRNA(Gln) amidotransferase subunit C